MIGSELRVQDPTTPEQVALDALIAERQRLAADAADAERRGTFMSQEAGDAADALTELERRAAREEVSASERTKAEKRLEAARAQASEPWAQRALGHRRAVADADQEITRFVSENFDALLNALHAEADDAARRVDAAAEELISAYEHREKVASRVIALTGVIRTPRPGDVAYSRAEAVANEARALLGRDGEAAPRLRHDPRAPRGANVAAEQDEQTWAFQ